MNIKVRVGKKAFFESETDRKRFMSLMKKEENRKLNPGETEDERKLNIEIILAKECGVPAHIAEDLREIYEKYMAP
jgi:hypothetical protein